MILREHLRRISQPEPIVKNPRMCTDQERQDILARDNFACRYCGKKNTKFHIDHVYPYSLGGLTTMSNLVTACSTCNHKKHNSIGMWPKPIGYFEPSTPITKEIKVAFGSLICTCLAMSLLYVGIDTMIRFPEFVDLGVVIIFIGMLFGVVSIGLQTQGN